MKIKEIQPTENQALPHERIIKKCWKPDCRKLATCRDGSGWEWCDEHVDQEKTGSVLHTAEEYYDVDYYTDLLKEVFHQQLQKAIQERDEWWNKHEQEMYEALEEEYSGLIQKSEEDIRLLTEEIGHLREDVQKARQSLLTDLQAYADKYELEDVRQVVEVFSDNK